MAPIADSVVLGPTVLNDAAVMLMTVPVTARRWAPLPAAGIVAVAVGLRPLAADPLELCSGVGHDRARVLSGGVRISHRDRPRRRSLHRSHRDASAKGTGSDAAPDFVASVVVFLVVGVVGRVAHVRQSRAQTIERRALAREREVEREIAAVTAAERQQIARELHDVVSHSLAVIIMQARGSVDSSEGSEQGTGEPCCHRANRPQGLVEMRRLLGLLGESGAPAMAPRPSLAQLETLVNDARLSGLHVEVSLSGPVDDLPPALDVSAFRIVQDGSTSAIRHGGQCCATVGLRCGPNCLELEITTHRVLPAPGGSSAPGRGPIGMRERVQMLGGEFDAGRAEDGFRVGATLPLQVTS